MKKDTGPCKQTNKHIVFLFNPRPLSLVHVRRNRQLILLKRKERILIK